MPSAIRCHFFGSAASERRSTSRMIRYSSETLRSSASGVGTTPAFSYSTPLCTSSVASPPSSRIMLGPTVLPSASVKSKSCSVAHQYSSRVSPFQANTGTPCGSSGVPCGPTTTAAAAWSWVEKMLHDTQRTSAPSDTSVSISTAVWTVMCSEPAMRAPCSGRASAYSRRSAIRPGISCSASRISLRPNSASAEVGDREVEPVDGSATSRRPALMVVVMAWSSLLGTERRRGASSWITGCASDEQSEAPFSVQACGSSVADPRPSQRPSTRARPPG